MEGVTFGEGGLLDKIERAACKFANAKVRPCVKLTETGGIELSVTFSF